MRSLYAEKLARMPDEALLRECERQGRIMEWTAHEDKILSSDEKIRAIEAFTACATRATLKDEDKEVCAIALRVLKYL